MLLDYHVHPDYSVDAEPTSVDEYCRQAIRLGMDEICFTPHFEHDSQGTHVDWSVRLHGNIHPMKDWRWFDAYFKDITNAAYKYAGMLRVRAGVEVGYDPRLEELIGRLVSAYPFDFVLGSVHCLDGVSISSREEAGAFFGRFTPGKAAQLYFETLVRGVRSGLFDAIGHVDIYKRHGRTYYGPVVETMHVEWAGQVFEAAAKRGLAVEINTSPLRAGIPDCHPSPDLLRLAQIKGIKYCTIGSDAHRLRDLGAGIDKGKDIAGAWAISIATFNQRQARVLDNPVG